MIDLNSSASQRAEATAGMLAAIEAGLSSRKGEPRRYLGASALGDACERKVQLGYIHALDLPHAPQPASGGRPEPRTQRIFDIGHTLEELAIRWLREAGFDLRTRDRNGEQFGFMVADGRFGGHCDGVLVAGPPAMTYPAVWEHKALGRKSWQEVAKRGVVAAKPLYANQVWLYQAYLSLPAPALFMATNRDTAELYLELLAYEADLAQRASDRAVRIIQATESGDLLPRGFTQAEHHECRMCGFRGFCWPEA